jgi:hypothetical protein
MLVAGQADGPSLRVIQTSLTGPFRSCPYARSVSDRPPYQSARDLPSIAALQKQLRGFKLLTTFILRGQKPRAEELERSLEEMVQLVDGFYALLGSRHWIFHDSLNTDMVRRAITKPVDEAQEMLIAYYKEPQSLRFMLSRLSFHTEVRPRKGLIDRAVDDYEAERYYATVMVLLAVMDGFVNDVDTQERRGLHARSDEEMAPWDGVAGHHLGLGSAHRSFTKTFGKISDEEVHELYRNGIVHGMLTNFDNVIVATKAWNRLFAVGDWATSRKEETKSEEPRSSWSEVIGQLAENDRLKKAIAAFGPRTVSDPAELATEPLYACAREFLDAWKEKNYGGMARHLTKFTSEDTPRRTAGLVRDQYAHVELEGFQITKLDFNAAASCDVEVDLKWNEQQHRRCRLRWIKETEDGDPDVLGDPRAEWRVMSFGPHGMIDRPSPR